MRPSAQVKTELVLAKVKRLRPIVSRKSRRFVKSQQSLPWAVSPRVQSARMSVNGRTWAGFVLGIALAIALHLWLSQPARLAPDWAWFAFVLPGAVLLAAVVPLWRQQRSMRKRQSDLQAMDWSEFQPLLCQLLEQQGYSVSESGNRPGMVDLVLRKDRRTILVHAKSWRSGRLGVMEVRELYAAMVTRSALGGMVVSCGRFGRNAMAFARETQIMLVDGAVLQSWMQKHMHQSTRPAPEEVEPATPEPPPRPDLDTNMLSEFAATSTLGPAPVPACPLCEAPMRERTARKGRHAGRKFWGCTKAPACKGVRKWEQGG
jgi:restriction system protein